MTLRDATITLDQNVLTGAVDVSAAGRPHITAQLTGGALDFSALTGGAGGAEASGGGTGTGAGGGAAPAGWPRDPIDASGLQAVDANISLAAESVDLGLAQLGRTRILTQLDQGRAVTEIKEMSAYGGAIAGSFVVNSRGGLSARANLTAAGVAIEPLLQQLADYDRLLASGDVSINLLAVGNDMHTLMNSLSGDGSFKLGKGELRGLDLVGMLRNLDTSYIGEGAKTIFDSIAGTFTVDGGVLQNDDLRLDAPLLTATGEGKVGIGTQDLNYRVVPALLETGTGGGLRVPLIITGPWADPKFRLDLEAVAKEEFGDEVEELKSRAEELVKDKISEELGVEVETLDEVEDKLKEELQDRATRGILDLLGGY